jgi:transposase-like protein
MIQREGWYMIRKLLREGLAISEIARRTGHDRKTIRKIRDAHAIRRRRSGGSEAASLTHTCPTSGSGWQRAC